MYIMYVSVYILYNRVKVLTKVMVYIMYVRVDIYRVRVLTRVMTPMRSISRLGLRGTLRGVECPEPGGDPPTEDPPQWEGGRELMERKRPPRPSPPTRHSISSARREVFSFSSWIILRVETIGWL